MKRIQTIAATAALAILTTGVVAQAESDNPDIQARQHTMETIGQTFKPVADMAKGKIDFDAATVQDALNKISDLAATVPSKFETEVVDPESDASEKIWTNWDDFVSKAEALQKAASDAAGMVSGPNDLNAVMGSVGAACGSCHKAYKL